ncbi:MAG: hypothetical protein FJ145_12230 [Deltaproteobacteria bacterium]|nr:hypothetical protein [Deltaproteobacteria bacterium]
MILRTLGSLIELVCHRKMVAGHCARNDQLSGISRRQHAGADCHSTLSRIKIQARLPDEPRLQKFAGHL